MGLLESAVNTVPVPPVGQLLDALNKFNPFAKKKTRPQVIDKFAFVIKELEAPSRTVSLFNDFLPKEVLPYGGRQKIVKEYYPGNREPTMHVMGPEENDVTLRGDFKDQRLPTKGSAQAVVSDIEGLRMRGNLLEISWGDFRRFAILKEAKFELRNTRDIGYEMTFDILGFTPPQGCKVIGRNDIPFELNNQLKNLNNAFRNNRFENDVTLQRNLIDELNTLIGDAAAAISIVTGYVDSVIGLAEQAVRTVNRAVGVVNNASANLNRFQRRIRSLSFTQISKFAPLDGGPLKNRLPRVTFQTARALNVRKAQVRDLQGILSQLKSNILKIQQTLPLKRHLVQDGETLQKLAFKFYNDMNLWTKIKEHNQLTDTTLNAGQVIEIPRV